MKDIDKLVERVCSYTISMPLERDPWQKAPALTAMIRSQDPAKLDAATRILERSIATQTSAGHLNYDDVRYGTYGHVSSFTPTMKGASLGYSLLELYERSPDERYLEAARLQAESALAGPRTRDGGLSARQEGVELWVDFVYLLIPFLAKLGQITNDQSLVDEAYKQLSVHIYHLYDSRVGLTRHAWTETPDSYGQSTFWSRGNAWLGTGIVDLLEVAPNHPDGKEAVEVLKTLIAAVVRYQDRSGFWREVLDDPISPLEASGTLMHSYTIGRGVELEVLDASYLEAAVRGFQVVAGGVGEDGAVTGVSVPPGGPGVPFGVTPFGQGFLMQSAQVLGRLNVLN